MNLKKLASLGYLTNIFLYLLAVLCCFACSQNDKLTQSHKKGLSLIEEILELLEKEIKK